MGSKLMSNVTLNPADNTTPVNNNMGVVFMKRLQRLF